MEAFYQTYRLSNGIRLIHSPVRSDVAHFGLITHTGTRDELQDEHGLAHFIEHMFFKGTAKRTAFQIISRLEDVGGEINAYTSKEETAIYASFLKTDYRKAIELIQDVFLHSKFSLKERKKEAEVILSEIQTYQDTPSEQIFDHAEELLFPDHPIGRNILGTRESLRRFENGMVEQFRQENYPSDELVLSSVGDIPFRKLVGLAERYFSGIPAGSRKRKRIRPVTRSGQEELLRRNTFQTHCMITGQAFPYSDERRIALHLLNNILGGPGMNSRLNMALRERRGFSYSAESHYATYTDTGAINVYFSCDHDRFQQCLAVTRKELRKLQETLITEKRLQAARKQLLGQIAISSDHSEHLMLTMGKSYLLFDRVDSLRDIEQKLERVGPAQLREIANELFDPSALNTLIYK